MATLDSSVTSLRSSLSLLTSSIDLLDSGVADFPRLSKILASQQHFELLPERTLQEAQNSVLEEIVPAIDSLLSTVDIQVAKMERLEESLKARNELLDGRLKNDGDQNYGNTPAILALSKNTARSHESDSNSDYTKAMDMKRLKQRKERLVYAVSRLEMESRQRRRDLRKSMAVAKDG